MALSHGFARGRERTPEYQAWSAMIQRCHNPDDQHFARYGQRGIVEVIALFEELKRSLSSSVAANDQEAA